jgi:hypothetical protein
MQEQVERSYGLNLKKKVLKSPIVWVVDWSEEAKQLHLDISRGPMTAGVVLADMPSRPTGNYDDREFNSKYLVRFCKACRALSLDQLRGSAFAQELVFAGTWGGSKFEFVLPMTYSTTHDHGGSTLPHTQPRWWEASQHAYEVVLTDKHRIHLGPSIKHEEPV